MLPKKGDVFAGTVVQVVAFGSFVEHPEGKHGLLHGQTAEVGATVEVRVIDVDSGRDRFSLELA